MEVIRVDKLLQTIKDKQVKKIVDENKRKYMFNKHVAIQIIERLEFNIINNNVNYYLHPVDFEIKEIERYLFAKAICNEKNTPNFKEFNQKLEEHRRFIEEYIYYFDYSILKHILVKKGYNCEEYIHKYKKWYFWNTTKEYYCISIQGDLYKGEQKLIL